MKPEQQIEVQIIGTLRLFDGNVVRIGSTAEGLRLLVPARSFETGGIIKLNKPNIIKLGNMNLDG